MERMNRVLPTARSFLRQGYEHLAMVLGLGALAFICLWWLPFALLFLALPRKWRVPLGRRIAAYSFTAYLWFLRSFCSVRLDCSALDTLRQDRSLIVVANHPSLLDAVILLSRLPKATCVMKATLKGNLLFGPAARFSGYISNEDPMQLIKQACNELAEGAHLVIFPEGTRTLAFPVNSFGQTAALIAQRSGVPIQTLLISFSTPYLGKMWPLLRKPRLPLHVTVRLGERFAASNDKEMLTQTLETYYRQQLNC
jgi:1-acyl-sn-glycerol-3-phosphate acyltransferase